jgi:hypothetical protein
VFTLGTIVSWVEGFRVGGSYKNVKYKGHTFVFKYDQDAPELLHIYARHRMEPRDAISIFFDSDAVTF